MVHGVVRYIYISKILFSAPHNRLDINVNFCFEIISYLPIFRKHPIYYFNSLLSFMPEYLLFNFALHEFVPNPSVLAYQDHKVVTLRKSAID